MRRSTAQKRLSEKLQPLPWDDSATIFYERTNTNKPSRRVRVLFFPDSYIVSSAKGGYSSHQELMNHPNSLQEPNENQRVATHHSHAWPANHTRHVIYLRTNVHTNFSGRGGGFTDFLCKKHYIAITANRRQD